MSELEIRDLVHRLDERIASLRSELHRSEAATSKALDLQQRDTAAHFEALNHADREALRVQGLQVIKEVYDRDLKEINARLNKAEQTAFQILGVASVAGAVVGGTASLLIRWLVPG